jgi:RNA polymerase sigma-70 factor, ECF subfamily
MLTEANAEPQVQKVSRTAPDLAFADALRANQAMVFSLAYHFLRDRGAAEEIAQDVFLQLYRNFDRLESPRHVVFWLRKTTSHRSIDYARKRGAHYSIALADTAEPPAAEERGDPLLNRRLRQLIATLPENPRMCMLLRYQEDLTPDEISEVLGMPVRTVKSHLHRSLAVLREKIERSMGDIR